MMRGTDGAAGSLFSNVDLEERIALRHPLRKIRQVVNDALARLDADFDRLCCAEGRPSIAPGQSDPGEPDPGQSDPDPVPGPRHAGGVLSARRAS